MEFGNYIKKQRNNLGFTQAELLSLVLQKH